MFMSVGFNDLVQLTKLQCNAYCSIVWSSDSGYSLEKKPVHKIITVLFSASDRMRSLNGAL